MTSTWLKQLVVALSYLALGAAIQSYFSSQGIVSVYWPSSGLALGALLVGGRRYIWGVFVGALLVNTLFLTSVWAVLGMTFASIIEALLGLWLLTTGNQVLSSLHTLSDYLRLVLLGGSFASIICALIGVSCLLLTHNIGSAEYLHNVLSWWMGDMLGIALLTPLILAWRHPETEQLATTHLFEKLVLFGVTFISGQVIFLGWLQEFFVVTPKAFLMFFFITWAAIRLEIYSVSLILNIVAIQALSGAYLQVGYFATDITSSKLHNYWLYMLILAGVEMALAIYVNELKYSLATLQLKDSALNAAANGIVITDSEGRIEWVNQAFSQLTGFSLNEAYGNNPRVLKSNQHDTAYYRQLWETILAGKIWHGEIINRRKDGSFYNEEMTITPLLNEKGKITHFVAVKQDISERKRTEIELHESHQLMYSLLNSIAEGAYGVDINGNCTFVNQSFLEIMGYKIAEEIVGKHMHELIHHSHADGSPYPASKCRVSASYRSNQEVHVTDEVFWHKNGTAIPVEYWSEPIVANNIILGAIVTFIDITDRKQSEYELRIAATVFQSHEGMFVTDANKRILRVNQAFTIITGYSAEEVIGKNPHLLNSSRQNTAFYEAIWQSIEETNSWEGEIWNQRKNGEIYPEYLTITVVKDHTGAISNYVAIFNDITLSKAASDEIERLAFYDPLTNLPNRRLLLDRLKPALASSHRSGRSGALMFIDMDNFKTLNDSLGHDMGDLLLQQVAQRLFSSVREGDTVARLGGDEFVVMLEDLDRDTLSALAQTRVVGNKILTSLNQPYQLNTHVYHSTPSIGVTLFKGHDKSIDELLKQADIAMYQAKNSGRNALRFFNPQMQATLNAHVTLESELRIALAQKQFQLYYQLQTKNSTQILGAEALIRWQHPERGLLIAEEFIPLAEETGLILPIGQWVLETACAQLKSWENNADAIDLQLAINISAKQFHQANFVEQVRHVLSEAAIKPDRLKLELTEGLMFTNLDETARKMNALSETGVRFSIDNFGAGLSSLLYLTQLPLDQIKIDQSVISNIGSTPSDAMIVKTIIGMANNLGIEVIAEGVETETQRTFLDQSGCSRCQGYLISKPLPIKEFNALINNA